MALYGSLITARAQAAKMEIFAPAFTYLDEVFRAGSPAAQRIAGMEAGQTHRVELEDGIFALEQAYRSKPRRDGFYESHRRYIDVQVIVAGREVIELAEVTRLSVREGYDAKRDLIVYADYEEGSVLRMMAGEAAIFFPIDGHMPGVRHDAEGTLVRKTVVKVPFPAGA